MNTCSASVDISSSADSEHPSPLLAIGPQLAASKWLQASKQRCRSSHNACQQTRASALCKQHAWVIATCIARYGNATSINPQRDHTTSQTPTRPLAAGTAYSLLLFCGHLLQNTHAWLETYYLTKPTANCARVATEHIKSSSCSSINYVADSIQMLSN